MLLIFGMSFAFQTASIPKRDHRFVITFRPDPLYSAYPSSISSGDTIMNFSSGKYPDCSTLSVRCSTSYPFATHPPLMIPREL